ncbi:uncharacterized protein LOC132727149 [Ruditapes philippinarum]|uniref:uncharacterized protein LOC132727149 n=1 Tax=Ruditapes philippinarum TaxID=129788 RepID=UPI00295C1D0B|nr:uncharacterized protein LOC132727149 [Ruditapes philippinarum]
MCCCLRRIIPCEVKSCGRCSRYILLLFGIVGLMSTFVYIDIAPDIHTMYINGSLSDRTTYFIRDVIAFVAHETASGMSHNTTLLKPLRHKEDFSNVSTLLRGTINTGTGNAEENTKDTSLNTSEHLETKIPKQFEIRNNWSYYTSSDLQIFILSAIGSNATSRNGYKAEIKLNGWHYIIHKTIPIKCCVLRNSGKISEYLNPKRTHQNKRIPLLGTQIACPIKGPLSDVKGVTLQFLRKQCPENKQVYIRPLLPEIPAKPVSMVICLKLLYGNIDNMALIYWIEFYIEMGVDKIFTFTYNIGRNTQKILGHYYNMGVLEWRKFNFPMKRLRKVGQKVPVFWEDEQVLVYDMFSRFHGYTYFAIIDLDEYLLPRKHNNLKNMMTYLTKTYPGAAGFTFNSYIFNKKWGISGTHNGSTVEKFVKRTPLFTGIYARRKNILLPSRVLFNSFFHTHTYTPKNGYKRVIVKGSIATINHYRVCYSNLKHLCDRNRAKTDKEILKVVEKIKPRTQWFSDSGGKT